MEKTLVENIKVGQTIYQYNPRGAEKIGKVEQIHIFDDIIMFKLDKCSDSAYYRKHKKDTILFTI